MESALSLFSNSLVFVLRVARYPMRTSEIMPVYNTKEVFLECLVPLSILQKCLLITADTKIISTKRA
jgi:hypothetical protein